MNILVIGNGFDLAHGLPTKYTDFLKFVEVIRQIIDSQIINIDNYKDLNSQILEQALRLNKIDFYSKVEWKKIRKEMWNDLIKNNTWIDYFLDNHKYQEKNWIDFEAEISRVIQVLEVLNKKIEDSNLFDDIESIVYSFIKRFKFLKKIYILISVKKCIKFIIKYLKTTKTYSSISDLKKITEYFKIEERLIRVISNDKFGLMYEDEFHELLAVELKLSYEKDLNRLIRALEIYLSVYISKLNNHVISPDIIGIHPDRIISFNYTNTYEKIYDLDMSKKYDYIHGKANMESTIETNNMVLGIDEYLPEDRKDKDIEFIAFKKFYQRIHKQTGCDYRNLLDKIRKENDRYNDNIKDLKYKIDKYENSREQGEKRERAIEKIKILYDNPPKHNLYIFGHSLDVTDKDILRDLILNDNVYTTIFYPNKEDFGRKIANLVKVIGQDELIRRTGGSTKTIEFKLQQPMKSIDELR